MKNRNNEFEPDLDAAFDYESFDDENRRQGEIIEIENPYEDYDFFDVEVIELTKKKFSVLAKDAKSAKEYFDECLLNEVDMEKDIDSYKRSSVAYEGGGTSSDITVPLWWYDVKE